VTPRDLRDFAIGDLRVRHALEDELDFLFAVYASTRIDELAGVGWSDEQVSTFLSMQATAQDAEYRQRHPHGAFCVIEFRGEAIGRLYTSWLTPRELRILDIALLPQYRNHGLGSQLLRHVIGVADESAAMVSLHVEAWNPARGLYQRLGFTEVASNDVYIRVECTPTSGVS
jgi:ribosomal protein S18 acetylase RimI-like enzyme